ncbi:MAG TPA: sulfite exporter TauE/SafE family protein [Tepidisphaeraceae bacterium]|nr:sulfite exporter TauE/SafE family protein [Tepidisphaeraceae bacterium]
MALFLVTLTAFVASIINSVAGGGTFLTFPALTGFGHLNQRVANMTSTIGLWPGSASSVAAAWADFSRIPRAMMIAFSIISLLGGAAGAVLLRTTSEHSFELVIPWLLAFATIVFGFSKPIARWAGRQHGRRTLGWTVIVGIIQVFVAVYGGYFGAGIGVLMLAGLSFAGLDDIHQMNALKVLLATLINLVAAVIFLFSHEIDWKYAGAMALAAMVGGFLGMSVARRSRPDRLRAIILIIGTALTGVYFAKNYLHAF